MSIRKRLVFLGVSVAIVPFCMIGITTYILLSKSLLDVAENKSLRFAKEASHFIEVTLNHKSSLLNSISSNPQILEDCKTGDFTATKKHIEAMHRKVGAEYNSIFILDRDGVVRADAVFEHNHGLDLSDRFYFKQAKLGKSAVAGPIPSRGRRVPGEPVIFISAPIMENGRFYGMVAMVFSTGFLKEVLSRNQIGETGHVYVLNEKGLVLAHLEKEYVLKVNLLELAGNESLKNIIQQALPTSTSYKFEGIDKVIGVSNVESTGWNVVFSQDREEIMTPLNGILKAVLYSALAMLAVTMPIIGIFWVKVSDPIQRMTDLLHSVTQHSKECIQQISLDHKIKYANPAFLNITGQGLEEVIHTGPNLNNENRTPPADIWSGLEEGNPWSGQVIYDLADSETVVLDTKILPLKNTKGAIQGYLSIGTDITEELKYKKRLQQTHKLEAIGTLAGGISHDFNNILGAIYGYARLASSKKKDEFEKERYISQIVKAADRARDLINRILVFARQKEVDMKLMSPTPVIKEAIKLLRATMPTTIELDINIKNEGVILAEPTQIHQIIMNLFTNAAHAIGNSTGCIKLDLEGYWVDDDFIKTHPGIKKGKHLVIRVSDSGKGMDQKTLDHIFDPFFTTKNPEKGTGLGLSVVHGIVKKLQGIITVDSELGKGTIFNLYIPCQQSDSSIEQQQQQSIIRKGTERIVLIDDESDMIETTELLLTSLGYKVSSYIDSYTALNAIKRDSDSFDLLITDYTMPGMTGLQLARNLQEAEINIPVILVSGFFPLEIEAELINVKISGMIQKPVIPHELSEAIQKALDSSD